MPRPDSSVVMRMRNGCVVTATWLNSFDTMHDIKCQLANGPFTYKCPFWLFLCGIMFRVSFSVIVKVRVRLKVLLTRLTVGVLQSFVPEWLASSHPKD